MIRPQAIQRITYTQGTDLIKSSRTFIEPGYPGKILNDPML